MKIKRCGDCKKLRLIHKYAVGRCTKCWRIVNAEREIHNIIQDEEIKELILLQDPICGKHHG